MIPEQILQTSTVVPSGYANLTFSAGTGASVATRSDHEAKYGLQSPEFI